MFELGKTQNVDKKSFVLVVNEFWDCVEVVLYCWLGLVWIGYRLSYNHPNEVILIVKGP